MEPYRFLIYDKPEAGIARITLNRPEVLNAVHLPLVEEIYAAADEAASDPAVAVLIYRGAGKSFCSGRDLKASAKLQVEDPEGWFAWRRRYRGFGCVTWLHPKVTVAAVQGYALGGGQSLAVTSDITVATDDARFGYPEVRYGQLGGGGHVWNWFMGAKKTKEYLFTGRTFGAQEALMFGLVNQVVPASQLDEYVMRLARDAVAIEQRNPGYLQANKFQINQRHLDLMHSPQVNPAEVEQVPREMEFLSRSKSGQEEFYRDVATSGFDAAMEKLHGTYSSKK